MRRALGSLLLVVLLAGCRASAHPVVKLGVMAPFEGGGRSLGYAVLPAVKQAVADANARGDFGSYRVLVVAYNDDLDAGTAARQAGALAVDPDVMGVVGPFTAETAAAAAPVFAAAAVPSLHGESRDPGAKDHAAEASQAQEAAGALLQALAADISEDGEPSRAGTAAHLALP